MGFAQGREGGGGEEEETFGRKSGAVRRPRHNMFAYAVLA